MSYRKLEIILHAAMKTKDQLSAEQFGTKGRADGSVITIGGEREPVTFKWLVSQVFSKYIRGTSHGCRMEEIGIRRLHL